MKHLLTTLVILIFAVNAFSQSPSKMSYQCVIRNTSGTLVINQTIGMKISILKNSATGTAAFVETQTTTTNANGLATIDLGAGTTVTNIFDSVDWSNGTYYLKTEVDPTGGTSYTISSISQFLSVPYALYAQKSGTPGTNGDNAWTIIGTSITNKNSGNVGVGNTSPQSKLSVGSSSQFQVDSLGNIKKINNVSYYFPSTQGSNGQVLSNNGSGTLSWQTAGSGTGSGWGLNGNSGTNSSVNFIGTTDTVSLVFKVNNQQAGKISANLYNTFLGYQSGIANSTGNSNTAIGYQSLYSNTTGNYNTANGYQTLYLNTTGYGNTANGTNPLYHNTTGFYNTASGLSALVNNTTGYSNTGIGNQALRNNTTGSFNTANGEASLYSNYTGNNNTSIGYYTDVLAGNCSNTTVIGNGASGTASNQMRFGDINVTSIGGQVGWTTLSDGRVKENVKEEVPGLSFINSLRPVTYTLNTKKFDNFIMQQMPDSIKAKRMQTEEAYQTSSSVLHTGFIAQEVEAAAKNVGYTFDGVDAPKNENDLYGIRYAEFVVPLVKSVQELNKQNQNLISIVEQLKKDNEEMRIRLSSLEAKK
jgi:trimeric autotransporter adhesin